MPPNVVGHRPRRPGGEGRYRLLSYCISGKKTWVVGRFVDVDVTMLGMHNRGHRRCCSPSPSSLWTRVMSMKIS